MRALTGFDLCSCFSLRLVWRRTALQRRPSCSPFLSANHRRHFEALEHEYQRFVVTSIVVRCRPLKDKGKPKNEAYNILFRAALWCGPTGQRDNLCKFPCSATELLADGSHAWNEELEVFGTSHVLQFLKASLRCCSFASLFPLASSYR